MHPTPSTQENPSCVCKDKSHGEGCNCCTPRHPTAKQQSPAAQAPREHDTVHQHHPTFHPRPQLPPSISSSSSVDVTAGLGQGNNNAAPNQRPPLLAGHPHPQHHHPRHFAPYQRRPSPPPPPEPAEMPAPVDWTAVNRSNFPRARNPGHPHPAVIDGPVMASSIMYSDPLRAASSPDLSWLDLKPTPVSYNQGFEFYTQGLPSTPLDATPPELLLPEDQFSYIGSAAGQTPADDSTSSGDFSSPNSTMQNFQLPQLRFEGVSDTSQQQNLDTLFSLPSDGPEFEAMIANLLGGDANNTSSQVQPLSNVNTSAMATNHGSPSSSGPPSMTGSATSRSSSRNSDHHFLAPLPNLAPHHQVSAYLDVRDASHAFGMRGRSGREITALSPQPRAASSTLDDLSHQEGRIPSVRGISRLHDGAERRSRRTSSK